MTTFNIEVFFVIIIIDVIVVVVVVGFSSDAPKGRSCYNTTFPFLSSERNF